MEQGLQVTFNPNGCFVEDMKNQGKLIAKGERNGRMFTLDGNMLEVNSMLFTHGKGARNIGIWHKRVGHVNFQRLNLMEKQNLVGSLPKFGREEVMSEVCEACQLGKQVRHPFLAQTIHVSSNLWKWSTQMCGPRRQNPLEDVSITWVSLMTTQGRCGSTSWNTKVKCFNIFWILKQWWRRRKVWTSSA